LFCFSSPFEQFSDKEFEIPKVDHLPTLESILAEDENESVASEDETFNSCGRVSLPLLDRRLSSLFLSHSIPATSCASVQRIRVSRAE
jgi:hypothetical protein